MGDADVQTRIVVHQISYRGKQTRVGVLRQSSDGVPMFGVHPLVDEINCASRTNIRVITLPVADYVLNDATGIWKILVPCSPFPVDAIIGYEKGSRPLGEEIVFECDDRRVVMPTGKYKGQKGIALVVPSPDSAYFRENGAEMRIDVPEWRLVAVPAFPEESGGWHEQHPETLIPHDKAVQPSDKARRIYRLPDAYVGFVMLGYNELCGDRRDFNLSGMPSEAHGVAIEVL